MRQLKVISLLAIISLVSLTVWAGVPQLINFQGQLKNNSGNPLANDTLAVEFKIYDAVTAGNVKWSEIDTVITGANGLFAILLGKKTPIPDSVFNDSLRWLGIKVGSDAEISPRSQLSSVGYSYVSSQWTSAGQNVFRLDGNVGIGTASPTAKLDVETPVSPAIYGSSSDQSGTGVQGSGSYAGVIGGSSSGYGVLGQSGYIGVLGDVVSSSGAVYGFSGQSSTGSGNAYGGYFSGFTSSGTSYGVYASGTGYGVYGSGFYGLYGVSSSGYGVYGNSASGNGIYGSGGNAGVAGYSSLVGVDGQGGNYGVYGSTSSGTGVYALSSSGPGLVASGGTNGVEATGGTRGIYATGSTYGVVAAGRYGAYGYSDYGTSVNDAGYAVFGASGNPNAWAGYFSGHCRITGTLTVDGFIYKNGGGFRIDHPLDPANKYLYHSFVESPDMKNIYDGVVTTDADGNASVTLPEWFGALNKDFRYQLTVMGQFAQAIVSKEIADNQFSIRTDKPNVKVSWQVTGIRQDAYANAHRIPVEEVKTGKEQGKYLHPEVYGAPASLGMHFEETQKLAESQKQMQEQQAEMETEHKLAEEQRVKMEQERKNLEEQRIKTEQESSPPKR